MGLNHLREWIAPGYKNQKPPKNPEETFSKAIKNTPSYETIRSLCNHSKHISKNIKTAAQYGLSFDDWPDVDSVRDFDLGPASDYSVDGRNVIEVIDEVVKFYENEWFSKKTP